MIGVDRNDDIYVTGHYPGANIQTAKLTRGGLLQWQVQYSNPGTHEQAAWLTVDPFGDVLVAGYRVAGSNRTPNGFVTLKYDPAGNLLWSDVIPSTWGSLQRVATDAHGDVVVLGRTWGAVGEGIVTIKYARNGTRLWTRTAGLSAFNRDSVGALVIDMTGNVFLTGGVLGTMLTIAYDPAGNLLWERTIPAMGSGWDLALSPDGAVYVGAAASGIGSDRGLVAKFDAAGTLLWTRTYPGIGVRRLAVDQRGDVIIASAISPSGGYFDWITQKLDPAGNVLWAASYDQHRFNDEVPYALSVGPDDEVYVTGQGGPGPSSGMLSYLRTVTVRYSRAGVEEWAATTFDSLRGLGVARHADGSVSVAGESTFTVFHYAQTGVWRSVDGALGGAGGSPRLQGSGSPVSARSVTLDLDAGAASAPAALIIGLSRVRAPFFGGMLVPAPDFVLGLSLSASGTSSLPLTWPRGLPAGFEITFQTWVVDASAPHGLSASNALVGVSE